MKHKFILVTQVQKDTYHIITYSRSYIDPISNLQICVSNWSTYTRKETRKWILGYWDGRCHMGGQNLSTITIVALLLGGNQLFTFEANILIFFMHGTIYIAKPTNQTNKQKPKLKRSYTLGVNLLLLSP